MGGKLLNFSSQVRSKIGSGRDGRGKSKSISRLLLMNLARAAVTFFPVRALWGEKEGERLNIGKSEPEERGGGEKFMREELE